MYIFFVLLASDIAIMAMVAHQGVNSDRLAVLGPGEIFADIIITAMNRPQAVANTYARLEVGFSMIWRGTGSQDCECSGTAVLDD